MMDKLQNITLSLFDGMSCGQIALRELGVVPEVYYASEIDKHAIAQTQYAFPATVQLGDVTRWREWDIDWAGIDLLLAGSPCQGFSFAGKQLAFDDPRSALFFVFVDILNHVRKHNSSVKFLLENVDMKREYMRVISDYCGVFPVNINSNLVSAQNRNRWYWTNIRTREEGLFGEVYTDIPQPEDRGIFLKDILEDEVADNYYLSDYAIQRIKRKNYSRPRINPDKAGVLNTKNNSGQVSFDSGTTLILQRPRGNNKGGYHGEKSPTFSSNSWEQNNLVIQLNPAREFGSQPRQQHRYYSPRGKSPTLNTCGGGGLEPKILTNNARIRRPTPTECARLQTIPDWYAWNPKISETQIYKMLGNGWTVEVIKHILKYLSKQTN